MATFTFDRTLAARLIDDLDRNYSIRLHKASGAAVLVQNGYDFDEFGDYIYRLSIELPDRESFCKNMPMNEADLIAFLEDCEFTRYEKVIA